MEESINDRFFAALEETFAPEKRNPGEYSPLALAYIGDAVYGLIIRTLALSGGNQPVKKLHRKTSAYVQASAQSRMMRRLQEMLSEDEHDIYRRGRNAKSVSPAKNQSLTDYRRATGLEALMGYLYLKKDWKRMMELIKIGLESIEESEWEKNGKQTI